MDTGRPIRGIVADVVMENNAPKEVWIKLECGGSIRWPLQPKLKLFTNVLVFWDYTRNKVRNVVREKDIDKDENGEPPEVEEHDRPDLVEIVEHDPIQEEANIVYENDLFDNKE